MIFSPGVGGGRGGTQQKFIRGGSRSNPLPFYITFSRKRYPFRIPSIDKWYPFHIPCLELCIPFNCCYCARLSNRNQSQKLNLTFSRLYKALKFIYYPFWALSQTQMTDFPSLLYTSTSEIPTLSYSGSLKKIPISGGASPYGLL